MLAPRCCFDGPRLNRQQRSTSTVGKEAQGSLEDSLASKAEHAPEDEGGLLDFLSVFLCLLLVVFQLQLSMEVVPFAGLAGLGVALPSSPSARQDEGTAQSGSDTVPYLVATTRTVRYYKV